MTKKIIFVGMNPSKVPVSRSKGSAYKRFHGWLDYLDLKYVSFTNLSFDPEWDLKFKTFDHTLLCTSLQNYDKIIVWGTMVSNYLKRLGFTNYYVLPHPSPLNRKLNDHKYVYHTLDKCKEYLND
jgi:G:T/U-mismatch repair DNA glycosylase